MPKELVFSSDLPYTEASSATSVVGVHWGGEMDGYVQVCTQLVNDDGKYLDGNGVVRVADAEAAAMRDLWSEGFYVSLDRRGINDLIRHLRRARDRAFGRDE